MKSTFTILSIIALASGAQAASVVNWVTTNGDAGFSGGSEATNSPITTDADGDTIVGSFPSVTLSLGQALVVTGQFNIAKASGTLAGGQFRIGAFESTGGAPSTGVGTGYVGAWANDPNANSFATTLGTVLPTSNPFGGGEVSESVDNGTGPALIRNTTYNFTLSLTRIDIAGNDLNVALDINGGAFFSGNADLTTASGSYTFDSAGFLIGGALNASSVTFTGIDATVVPEPSAGVVALLGGLALLRRRRA